MVLIMPANYFEEQEEKKNDVPPEEINRNGCGKGVIVCVRVRYVFCE